MDQLFNEVKEIIRKYAFDKKLVDEATEQSRIIADMKINSARIVDIVLDIEEKYGIDVDDISIQKIHTLGDAVNVVREKNSK
jgi:acyl carrier protein